MNFFTTTLPGLFCLAVGTLSILALKRLLPDRKSADDTFESTSDYTVELVLTLSLLGDFQKSLLNISELM